MKPIWLYRQLFLRSEVDRMLSVSMTFGVLLVAARVVYTGERDYLFIIWNLFLGYIPYFISSWVSRTPTWAAYWKKFALVFTGWILFIPNSFYILTDLFHLGVTAVRRSGSIWR